MDDKMRIERINAKDLKVGDMLRLRSTNILGSSAEFSETFADCVKGYPVAIVLDRYKMPVDCRGQVDFQFKLLIGESVWYMTRGSNEEVQLILGSNETGKSEVIPKILKAVHEVLT